VKLALTGATGFIGSHVLTDLQEHGHDVTACVRAEAQAQAVEARGATAAIVDLYDSSAFAAVLRGVDGAIHTASPGDATSADLDAAVVDAAIDAFAGTAKPYAHISGLWIYGSNLSVTEDSPFDAPPLVAWKLPIQARLLYGSDIRSAVVVAGTAYGDGGGGIPALLLGSPRDDAGKLIMLGSGRQHWATVHVADLAEVFRLVLECESARGYYIIEDESGPTVADLTEAAAVAAGAPGAVPGSDDEARARLGDAFADVLLLDQSASATKARAELGWRPSHPGLVDDFRNGSYRTRQPQEQR
jgi:nucleoside-diphosphate-sugar epimerase